MGIIKGHKILEMRILLYSHNLEAGNSIVLLLNSSTQQLLVDGESGRGYSFSCIVKKRVGLHFIIN